MRVLVGSLSTSDKGGGKDGREEDGETHVGAKKEEGDKDRDVRSGDAKPVAEVWEEGGKKEREKEGTRAVSGFKYRSGQARSPKWVVVKVP